VNETDDQRKLDEEDAAILLRRVQDMGEAVRQAKAERLTNRRTARREKRLVLALQGRLYQLATMAGPQAVDIAEISRALNDAVDAERCARDTTPILRLREQKARANLAVAAGDLARLLRVQAGNRASKPEPNAGPRRGKKCDQKEGGTS